MNTESAQPNRDLNILLEARAIVRRYPGNIALKGVTFRAHRNKINVLIGENGAGKSTLMRILAGVEMADEGQILLDGNPVHFRSPRDAASHGIAIVHQELGVLPNLDVTENIFAGRELVKANTVVDRANEDRRSTSALERLRNPLQVRMTASQLSLGCRQLLELARAIAHGAKLLILDEPTSALSLTEAESLFRVLEEMKASGVTIIYISHRLHELLRLGDTFTVLRSGEIVGEGLRNAVTREWIVERMSGRAEARELASHLSQLQQPVVLRAEGISIAPGLGEEIAQSPVDSVSLDLHQGEILGIYGLLGAGRTELLEALAGARHMLTGSVLIRGKSVRIRSVGDAIKAGIVLVPEDRQRDGLIPELSIRENIALDAPNGPLLSKAREDVHVRKLIKELNIVASDLELPVQALSGGNQQKVLLARCLMRSPTVLLLDEPTRGVDIGAKAEIYRALRQLASNGISILFTSSEIEETRLLAHRVLVMCQGRISAEFTGDLITDENLFSAASPHVATTYEPSSTGVSA
jgi:erythritol transport system ATP-binding protein